MDPLLFCFPFIFQFSVISFHRNFKVKNAGSGSRNADLGDLA